MVIILQRTARVALRLLLVQPSQPNNRPQWQSAHHFAQPLVVEDSAAVVWVELAWVELAWVELAWVELAWVASEPVVVLQILQRMSPHISPA
jgi:hypothetical protein